MQRILKIQRFDPEKDKEPYWDEFTVEVEATDRLLDALNYAKWYRDGTLAYRRSCAHGICGSDGMLIDGRNTLACKILMKELGERITIAPLPGFTVIKDLIVDMDWF